MTDFSVMAPTLVDVPTAMYSVVAFAWRSASRFTASADAASVSLTASFSEPSRRALLIPEIVPVVAFAASVVAAPSFAPISSDPFRFLSVATFAATSRVVASIRRCASAPYSSRRPPTSLAGAPSGCRRRRRRAPRAPCRRGPTGRGRSRS